MEFDETQRFWYPRVALNAWTDFAFCSDENLQSGFRKSQREVKPLFVSLSLSLLFIFFFSFPFCFFFFPFFSFLAFFLIDINRTPFVCSPSHFVFFFHFPFSLLLFHFLFSFSFSLFLFYHSTDFIKVGETSPHFPLPCHMSSPQFYLIFLDFSFPIISLFDTWLHVSHSHKCTTWLMPCVTPLGCHVASTCSCHVLLDTRCLKKHKIPTVLESEEIRRGNYISQDEFNGEVRFVIRDLENFLFSIKITVLPFFRKIEFFPGFIDKPS